MLILTGGSGSGKSEVFAELKKGYGFKGIVACTTREKRPGEVEGRDYHFIDEDTFLALQSQDFFAETAAYDGWNYGTAASDYEGSGFHRTVVILSPEAVRQIKEKFPDAYSVYLFVPRRERLVRILERDDDIDEACRRSSFEEGQFSGFDREADLVVESSQTSVEELAEKILSAYWKKDRPDGRRDCPL